MYEQERVDLAQYRMDKAQEALNDAGEALRQGRLANAANRSYYAFFHAVRALSAGFPQAFRRYRRVSKGLRENGCLSRCAGQAVTKRVQSPHTKRLPRFLRLLKREVAAQVADAEQFVETLKRYLSSLIS